MIHAQLALSKVLLQLFPIRFRSQNLVLKMMKVLFTFSKLISQVQSVFNQFP